MTINKIEVCKTSNQESVRLERDIVISAVREGISQEIVTPMKRVDEEEVVKGR